MGVFYIMMSIKKVLAAMLILSMSIITGCHQKPPIKEEEFKGLLKNINENREAFHKKSLPDINKYIGNPSRDKVVFKEGEIEAMLPSKDMKPFEESKLLTSDEAITDAESFFKLLKSSYSLYNYFGGDTTFNKAKEEITDKINTSKEISNGDFVKLLRSNLAFIKDGHFQIGEKDELKLYYSYEEETFLRDEKGIYKVNNNRKYYLKSVDSKENLEDFLKVTVNEQGKLTYELGFTTWSKVKLESTKQSYKYIVETPELPIKISYESKGEKFEENVSFKTEKEVNYHLKDCFSLERSNNIPVITFNNIDEDISVTKISDTKDKLKGHNVIVIDLRGNYGGAFSVVNRITEKMGIPNTEKRVMAELYSEPALLYKRYALGDKADYSDKLNRFVIREKLNVDSSLEDNDKLIVLLIDTNVASAGEGFIRRVYNMKNVILVGTNTSGTNLTYDSWKYKLANSNLMVSIGAGVYVYSDIDNFELNGFTPDIWVNSTESLDKTMKFIDYYNLEELKK